MGGGGGGGGGGLVGWRWMALRRGDWLDGDGWH